MAQEIYVEVSKDVVAVNERFTYSIISHKKCDIYPPKFDGFQLVSGPSVSESSSYQYINGKSSREVTYMHTFTLRATAMGEYTIGKAKLECKKKTYESEPVKIIVNSAEDVQASKIGTADYYFTLESDKEEVFVGEPFTVHLMYYAKSRPSSVEGYENGSAGGLWRQDLRDPSETYKISQKDIKGTRYYVIELRRELCIPLRAGKITVEPSYGSVIYSKDFFTQYRQDGYSNSLDIRAKEIPGEKPEDFNGLVGSFELLSNIDKQEVNAGEAIELTLTIRGLGNFNAFDDPKLNLPESFLQQDPVSQNETQMSPRGVEGFIEYKFSFTPTEKGNFTIDPYHFSYYDMSAGRIKSTSTEPFNIKVHSKKGGDIIVDRGVDKVEVDASDIRYIHDDEDHFYKDGDVFFGSIGYVISVASPLLLSVSLLFFRWRRQNMSDEAKQQLQQKVVKKSVSKELEKAKSLLANGDQSGALRSLQSGLNEFFKVKLSMGMSDLSQQNISARLQEKGVSQASVEAFTSVWAKTEMAQFAPTSSKDFEGMIKETEQMLNAINQELS